MLNRHHKFFLIALMEPFQHIRTINHYRRRLGICLANSNCNGKIWYFVADNIDVEVLMDSPQQITLKLFLQDLNQYLLTTLVYAKCSASERLELWEDIYHLSNTLSCSWLIGRDFNVVLNNEKKIGGNPIQPQDIEDFAFCINSCDLEKMKHVFFERLDRMLVNSLLLDNFGNIEVEYLARPGSDHAPLLCTYGDKHQNQKAQAETKRYLHYEEEYWRNKSGLDWFVDGDKNTRFFHNLVKGRRKKLQIKRIQNSDGSWIEDDDQMADETVHFYSQ
ncbi:uncharacterized protein LOC132628659 [Lycium barbarum]|uniref:uncharacterized protein LOC132628659 n=1 Tax=Lycium barbarum TaxID=112863 RepID=UPI00293E9C98|nr:uncharacterized protein LOC132628659 [Lycium barbarum]